MSAELDFTIPMYDKPKQVDTASPYCSSMLPSLLFSGASHPLACLFHILFKGLCLAW